MAGRHRQFRLKRQQGRFDARRFADTASLPQVKMIEIKLSQCAKPGHGGVLPACKNTPEIDVIRAL